MNRKFIFLSILRASLDENISVSANCVVLAIDAPLPYGDKTELTKQLVGIEKIQLSYFAYKFSGIDRSVLSGDIYS